MNLSHFRLLSLGLLVPLLAGCDRGPPVVGAQGVVRLKGQPLAGAVVVFSPRSADGKTAVAITDEAGTFQVKTNIAGEHTFTGAVPGDYAVTVSKNVPPSGMTEEKYQSLLDAEEAQQSRVGYTGKLTVPLRVELVPSSFSDANKTKLAITVPPQGVSDLSFDIP